MFRVSLFSALALAVVVTAKDKEEGKPAVKSRTYTLTYAGAITGQKAGATVAVWIPVAASSDEQTVEIVGRKFPAEAKLGIEGQYSNLMYYFEAKADDDGKVSYEIVYKITRREVKGLTDTKLSDEKSIARFLAADDLVPIAGKPLDLLKGKDLPEEKMDRAKAFYDLVNNHMKYDKSKPGWGRGDSVWACDSKFGNCTDFHSLFISLARAHKIPAKFEIGFSIPEKRGGGEVAGYHCWAKFRPSDRGWIGVDISEANKDPKMKDYYFGNLTEDRVTISVGRDINLSPKQHGKPLNYFIFPYAEVDGKPVAGDKIVRKNSYEDAK